MPDLYWIINKSSNTDEIKKLISLRAFLLDESECPWAILYDFENYDKMICYLKNNTSDFFLNINTKNINKLGIKAFDIQMMPKNKRLKFIEMINCILNNFNLQNEIIIDKIRINPLYDDSLFDFIKTNRSKIKKEIYNIFYKRNNDLKHLFTVSNFDFKNNYTCSYFSIELKMKNYWKNLWADSYNYDDNSIIDKVIL